MQEAHQKGQGDRHDHQGPKFSVAVRLSLVYYSFARTRPACVVPPRRTQIGPFFFKGLLSRFAYTYSTSLHFTLPAILAEHHGTRNLPNRTKAVNCNPTEKRPGAPTPPTAPPPPAIRTPRTTRTWPTRAKRGSIPRCRRSGRLAFPGRFSWTLEVWRQVRRSGEGFATRSRGRVTDPRYTESQARPHAHRPTQSHKNTPDTRNTSRLPNFSKQARAADRPALPRSNVFHVARPRAARSQGAAGLRQSPDLPSARLPAAAAFAAARPNRRNSRRQNRYSALVNTRISPVSMRRISLALRRPQNRPGSRHSTSPKESRAFPTYFATYAPTRSGFSTTWTSTPWR